MKTDKRDIWKGLSLWVCFLSFLLTLCGDPSWMATSGTAPIWTRMTYQWIHGNVIHFGMNAMALLTIVFKLEPRGAYYYVALILSMICPKVLIGTMPVVGLSGIVFALMGLMLPSFSNWKWAVASNAILLTVTALMPNIAVGLHAWCYIMGASIGLLVTPIRWTMADDGKR